jgi:cysteine-rich repeat protein
MESRTPALAVHRCVPVLLWVCLTLPMGACLQLESTPCASGVTCPVGWTCAANSAVCIEQRQDGEAVCGDGTVQPGEQCDDGNLKDGDGCSHNCESNESCGNGKLDPSEGEVCDDHNRVSGDGCSADCKSTERCGNGILDLAEVCDDGNEQSGDGCSKDCKSDERCGNSIIDVAAGELCDDGNRVDNDGCSADCRSGEACGNGIRDANEECDDGNTSNGDNCLNVGGKCLLSWCGDGFTDTQEPRVEECDDRGESKTCNGNCTVSKCGDGIVNTAAGEQCDTRGQSVTCNGNCTIARCGDGVTNTATGEQCDDGNTNQTDGCSNNCKVNLCGDGILQDGESCDDGNTMACGRCSENCQVYHYAKATGSITAVAGGSIEDGDTLTLNDGVHVPKIFEFDRGSQVEAGRVRIAVRKKSGNTDVDMSANEVAQSMRAAINLTHFDAAPLMIDATGAASSAVVTLRNITVNPEAGSFGNQHILDTVNNAGFLVVHMSGGAGDDCPMGTPCGHDVDCASGSCNSMGICR